jgi:hypothetical protein
MALLLGFSGGTGVLISDRHLGMLIWCSDCLQRVLRVFVDEGDQALKRAVTRVVKELARAGWLEFDGRETGDLEGNTRRKVVLGGFHLGNGDTVLKRGEVVTEAVPGRLQALAVAAPGVKDK